MEHDLGPPETTSTGPTTATALREDPLVVVAVRKAVDGSATAGEASHRLTKMEASGS